MGWRTWYKSQESCPSMGTDKVTLRATRAARICDAIQIYSTTFKIEFQDFENDAGWENGSIPVKRGCGQKSQVHREEREVRKDLRVSLHSHLHSRKNTPHWRTAHTCPGGQCQGVSGRCGVRRKCCELCGSKYANPYGSTVKCSPAGKTAL